MPKPETTPIAISDPAAWTVLWAAMCAMVQDNHAPQDNLSADEWKLAERVFIQLDALVNGDQHD